MLGLEDGKPLNSPSGPPIALSSVALIQVSACNYPFRPNRWTTALPPSIPLYLYACTLQLLNTRSNSSVDSRDFTFVQCTEPVCNSVACRRDVNVSIDSFPCVGFTREMLSSPLCSSDPRAPPGDFQPTITCTFKSAAQFTHFVGLL